MIPFSQNLFVPWYNNSPFQAYLYLIGDSLPTIDRLSCKNRAIFALIKMATGLDGLLFTLTTLIVARIIAFLTQIDLPDNEYMVEDLGLYSGTKPKPSCYDFSLDILYPRIVLEKTRHYTNRRYYKYLPNQNTTTYTSIIIILLRHFN